MIASRVVVVAVDVGVLDYSIGLAFGGAAMAAVAVCGRVGDCRQGLSPGVTGRQRP